MPGPTQWQCILKVNGLAVEKDQGTNTPTQIFTLIAKSLHTCSYKCLALCQKQLPYVTLSELAMSSATFMPPKSSHEH